MTRADNDAQKRAERGPWDKKVTLWIPPPHRRSELVNAAIENARERGSLGRLVIIVLPTLATFSQIGRAHV